MNACFVSVDAFVKKTSLRITQQIQNEPSETTCAANRLKTRPFRSALKSHVQSHSGKRYGCSRCKYHTDRKFDVRKHFYSFVHLLEFLESFSAGEGSRGVSAEICVQAMNSKVEKCVKMLKSRILCTESVDAEKFASE